MFVLQVCACLCFPVLQLLQYTPPPLPKWQYWQSTKQILVNLLPFKQIFLDPAPDCSQDKTCSREISREYCRTGGTLIPFRLLAKSSILFITALLNKTALPSCDTALSNTFKPVRDVCFFPSLCQNTSNVCFNVSWHEMRTPPLPSTSTLYTVFGVYRLINIWGEAENEAWHGSSSVSQLLHSSMTGELRSVYDLYFYWAEFWLCFSLNSTFFPQQHSLTPFFNLFHFRREQYSNYLVWCICCNTTLASPAG